MEATELKPVDERERRLLAHLARAGELLRQGQLDGADGEVNQALTLASSDVRARNLRGLIWFKAGRNDEALQVYRDLATELPDDAALRLNLGLVELQLGHNDAAATSLAKVVASEPKNRRAHAYYGLALMRAGDLHMAREEFVRAGQADLLRQVDERLAVLPGAPAQSSDLRRAAEQGLRAVTSGAQPFTSVEGEGDANTENRASNSDSGLWLIRNAGAAGSTAASRAAERRRGDPLRVEGPVPVLDFATQRLLRPGRVGEPFAIAEGGMLVVRVDGRLPTRTFGTIASTGQLQFEPMTKRVRGKQTEEPFGDGPEGLFLASGRGIMVVAPRGARFHALALKDDVLYLREAALFSFEETLHWESGRVPGSASPRSTTVQLRGTGRCVIRSARPSFAVKLDAGETLFAAEEALLGWIGRVIPRQICGSDGEPTPYVECGGEGALILEEPPAA